MAIHSAIPDTARMNEQTYDDLFEEAIELAYTRFPHVSDDHVTAVFERLAWNQTHGLDTAGAVTVH